MEATSVRRQMLTCLVAGLTIVMTPVASAIRNDDSPELAPPPLYEALTEGELESAGQIRNGRLVVDRFEFELTDGELYLLSPVEGHPSVAVFLGDGIVRSYPPDGVEHQQLERFLDDDDFLEASFDRFVFWFGDDTGVRLREQSNGVTLRNADDAQNLLKDRRRRLLEDQLTNPDGRLVVDLLARDRRPDSEPTRSFFSAQIDSDDHGWLTLNIEPLEREEVQIARFDRGRKIEDIWMGFHASSDFDVSFQRTAFDGFPRDPLVEGKLGHFDDGDDDDWNALDLGLSPRSLTPDHEAWTRLASVPRADVDLALEGNGDAKATAAIVIQPHQPLDTIRLRLSPVLKVTDVRWNPVVPDDTQNVHTMTLLTGKSDAPDAPVELAGEPVRFVRATHDRRMADDLYEPWVTVVLPRTVAPTETFIVEVAYEGELIDYQRDGRTYVLKDTLHWMPRHPHSRGTAGTRMRLTYRVPERFRVASGSTLLDEYVVDDTRIMRWVSPTPVESMSFNMGRFDVTDVEADALPGITIYADRRHAGFAPGNLNKTVEDLTGALQTYTDYFGPYPFDSLLLTETASYTGLAFPGLILLSFQAFGELHTGEASLFRAHEVAHQWWGAAVEFEDYRDQWISEGFAQYASALFMLRGMEREDEFLDILDAWRLDVLGEVNVGQGIGKHYGFQPGAMQRSDGHESGPLAVGYRLRSSDTPYDYRLLVYEKGAFVLHMLRMMLTDLDTGDDEPFRHLMRGFFNNHLSEAATTAAFEAAVTEAFGEPMDWFFEQWIHGVDVPTYRPDLKVTRLIDSADPFVLHGRIEQQDVPDGFRMPVPIVIRFDDRLPIAHRIWVDTGTVDVEIPLPAEPTAVEFNYHHGVLAHVR